jgi:hypothetical protein
MSCDLHPPVAAGPLQRAVAGELSTSQRLCCRRIPLAEFVTTWLLLNHNFNKHSMLTHLSKLVVDLGSEV